MSQPGALALLGAFFCANFVAVVLLTWMPKFLFDRFHMSLAMSGLTATIYVQLASMLGAVCGGWLADSWRAKRRGGRMLVQALGVFGGAPFVVLCGMTRSLAWLIVALTVWGFFKGLYDANIFASVFDVIRPEARGSAAGLMNTVGWLGGGGSAPIVIAWLASRYGLGGAIAMASIVYLAAGGLLLTAARIGRVAESFTRSDIEKPSRFPGSRDPHTEHLRYFERAHLPLVVVISAEKPLKCARLADVPGIGLGVIDDHHWRRILRECRPLSIAGNRALRRLYGAASGSRYSDAPARLTWET